MRQLATLIKPWIIKRIGKGLKTRVLLRRYCTFVGEVFDLMRVMCGPVWLYFAFPVLGVHEGLLRCNGDSLVV